MADHPDSSSLQLKEACKSAGARWAVWLHRDPEGWNFTHAYGLTKARQPAVTAFILDPKTATWLGGAFSSGRARDRQTGSRAPQIGVQRVYVFPNIITHSALLVGSDGLDRYGESLFRILALQAPQPQADDRRQLLGILEDQHTAEQPNLHPPEASYNPDEVLTSVVQFLAGLVSSESALLSIRSGDTFRVETTWNCPGTISGRSISLRESPLLEKIVSSRVGIIVDNSSLMNANETLLGGRAGSWMGVPVVIGQRIIGHMEFAAPGGSAFDSNDLERAAFQAARLSYVIENAIMFAEAARYLQQFALLNELASAAAVGGDTHEVAHRVIQRLRRAFRAGAANIFLRSADGRTYRDYGSQPGVSALLPALETKLVAPVLQHGIPVRLGWGDLLQLRPVTGEDTTPVSTITKSALAVPLKYRGQVIGAIAVRSSDPEPFTFQDEQLLVLIAGHLAGLFENMRLSDETRDWARTLGLIHQVVRRVVGLTEVGQIARVAAELMISGFSYERAAVIIQSEELRAWVAAIGQPVESVVLAPREDHPAGIGLTQRVMEEGTSRLSLDVEQENGYLPAEGWSRGSQMCIPLREGAHTFGALVIHNQAKNAFAGNDLLSMEALSGVLSSVILSAQRYVQLQESFRQLQAVRESAIDLAADLDLDTLLHRVVHRARELVGARGVELGLLDEKAGAIRLLVSDTPWFDSRGDLIPLMAGVAGRVAAFGEPVVIENYNTWNGRLFPERTAPFKTVAGVPLKFRGTVIGTLTMIDDRPDWSFKPEHLQLLELLAPQATVWIRNARLYQELQERIEAQRMAELRLVRSARLAAVGEMAAGVAHELNNPLTSVSGFVELVLEELPKDSPHHSDLELVLREAQRARGVVRRLLDFSRPVENQRIRTDLNELITDVLALVRHLARTGGVNIELNLQEGLPWVSVDPGHIKQVVLNLVNNAIQAMNHGGVLTISTEQQQHEGDWVVIRVEDTGEGISPENLERIFEPFFTTRPAGSGTGLGLSVSYGIVNEHGGSIEVDSVVEQGTCFRIFLPLDKENNRG